MYRILFSALFLFPSALFAQKYFDKSKAQVKKELGEYVIINKQFDPVITETDSSLVMTIKEEDAKPVRFIYGFDGQSGKCNSQRTEAGCDTCYKKYLQNLLDQKQYKWKKLNENQFISRFEDRLMLEVPVEDNIYTFTLFKTIWTKEFYDLLVQ
jgi:hypothetical protein